MPAFDETFMLLRQERVVICRSCHHAVLPGSVRTHVNTQHRYLPNPERRQIVERALELEKESVLSSDINRIRFPGREDAAVPDLPVWTDGKKCLLTGSHGAAHAGIFGDRGTASKCIAVTYTDGWTGVRARWEARHRCTQRRRRSVDRWHPLPAIRPDRRVTAVI
ncbi:hypothetical protein QC761_0102700 [Podospora bellae-mahoneyi]|uniref:C2H2-type domain-containing protein n=1 Tax=Podospora bellae-mahoneyi TaxID=2093777 RepID=A0ABR0F6K6_9PEZI|nr:hypothetical protein QC761_0102700 [Podospora bellae-mahoneyi]